MDHPRFSARFLTCRQKASAGLLAVADVAAARYYQPQLRASLVREVAYRLRTDPLPFLPATPTWGTGLLEPGELVDRPDACRRAGVRVAAVDFGQALLRVCRGDRTAAVAAAERAAALGTEEGERLARLLTGEGDRPCHDPADGGRPHPGGRG